MTYAVPLFLVKRVKSIQTPKDMRIWASLAGLENLSLSFIPFSPSWVGIVELIAHCRETGKRVTGQTGPNWAGLDWYGGGGGIASSFERRGK